MHTNSLNGIKDFRRKQGRMYELDTILQLSVLAILSNANSYRKVAIFIKERFEELKKSMNIHWENAPSYSAIRYSIIGVSSESLEACFRGDAENRLNSMNVAQEQIELSIDGKVIKGSFDNFKDQKAIQVLSVFCHNFGLILAHEEVEEKTNEIPVTQYLVPKLPFQNCIFTCDAMNCQTKTISAITGTNNDFIVQVKSNQKLLLNDCILASSNSTPLDTFTEEIEKGHGRITRRTATVFNATGSIEPRWEGIDCIIEVHRDRKVFNTKEKKYQDTSEVSYYISTTLKSAEKLNSIIRGHWGIENANHYVKDVTFGEDNSRIRVNPQNMVKLRSFALNILRHNGVTNIAASLYQNSLNFSKMMKLGFAT